MSTVLNVARMQLINKWTFLGLPMLILVASTGLTFAIWAILPAEAREQTLYSGSSQAVMWYFLALGIQAMTYTFPFSQAMSVSRRSFYLGTVGLFAAIALGFSVLYYVLGLIELATNGWGLNGRVFALGWISENNGLIQILFYFAAMVLLFMLGFWFATIYMRWKTTGMLVTWIAIALVLVGLVALLVLNDWWMPFWMWVGTVTVPGLIGVFAIAAVVLGGGSYLTLRRAAA